MNEDDTFIALKKISYEQLDAIINGIPLDAFKEIIESDENRSQFLKTYGWTLEEFEKETRKKYVKDRQPL